MTKLAWIKRTAAALFLLSSSLSYAWDHSINIGYGISHDPNHTRYNNSGVFLNGDIYSFHQDCLTNWTINGAVGQWYTTAPHHKNLTTAALALALRLYPWTTEQTYPTYLLGSVGPAYLSNRHFGRNTQAKNVTFQWNLGLGAEFRPFDVNLRLVHFSNAYLARPDQGFTIMYLLSVGYLF
jgi:hypothetical protein